MAYQQWARGTIINLWERTNDRNTTSSKVQAHPEIRKIVDNVLDGGHNSNQQSIELFIAHLETFVFHLLDSTAHLDSLFANDFLLLHEMDKIIRADKRTHKSIEERMELAILKLKTQQLKIQNISGTMCEMMKARSTSSWPQCCEPYGQMPVGHALLKIEQHVSAMWDRYVVPSMNWAEQMTGEKIVAETEGKTLSLSINAERFVNKVL
jgi:hypothetical protein